MTAQTRPGFAAEGATPILPMRSGKSSVPISSQFSPPSVDFQTPEPGPPERIAQGVRCQSHIAAYSTRGLFGSNRRSTAPVVSSM